MKVPKLRFGGFEDGWQSSEIYKIATISSGGTPDRAKSHYWNGSIPWVTTSLIDFNVIDNSIEFITQDGLKNSSAKLFPKDTLLIAMYGQGKTRGKVAILGLEASTNQACAAITFHSSTVNVQFAFQNLIGRYDEIRNLSNSGGQENLNASLIKQIQITFPSLFEQTKIANFLTAIDEKITQLTQKCDLLAQYKKGVMQQIFSQKLRFKDDDGREFPEWEELNFDDGFYLANNKKTQIKSSDYSEFGRIPVVDQGQKRIVGYTNNKDVYDDVPVIIFGDHTRILKWIDFKFAPGADGTQVIKTTKKLNLKFGYYCLCNIELPNLGYSRHMKEMREQYFFVPASIKEQTKIANFLTAIDDKITQAQTQLDAVKLYKKGLLQQMFV